MERKLEPRQVHTPKVLLANELRHLLQGEPVPFLESGALLSQQLLQDTLQGKRPSGFLKAAVLTTAASIDIARMVGRPNELTLSKEMLAAKAVLDRSAVPQEQQYSALVALGGHIIEATADTIVQTQQEVSIENRSHFHPAFEALTAQDLVTTEGKGKLSENAAWEIILDRLLFGNISAITPSQQLWRRICTYMQDEGMEPSLPYAAASFGHSLATLMNLTPGDTALMEYTVEARGGNLEESPNLSVRDIVNERGERQYSIFYFSKESKQESTRQYNELRRKGTGPFPPTRPPTERDEDIVGCFSMPGGKGLGASLVYAVLQRFAQNIERVAQQIQ